MWRLSSEVLITVCVCVAAAGIAFGVPRTFSAGSVASASDINANFAALESELTALRARMDTGVCGVTPTAFSGQMQGYAGAAASCRSVSGCGAGARMCMSWEVAAHLARPLPLPSLGPTNLAWVSTAVYELSDGGKTNDCDGWTQAVSDYGQTIAVSGSFNNSSCAARLPVLCCD